MDFQFKMADPSQTLANSLFSDTTEVKEKNAHNRRESLKIERI